MDPTAPKNKFAQIRTSKELNKAIMSVTSEREKLGKGLGKDVSNLIDHYRPANLMSSTIGHVVPYFSWGRIGLGLVRGAKKMLGKAK